MLVRKKVVASSIFIIIVLLTFLPFPLPIDFPIKVTQANKNSKIQFSSRPIGLLGLITGDNPWVYASVINSSGQRINIADVWADSSCDGVTRLNKELRLQGIQCSNQ